MDPDAAAQNQTAATCKHFSIRGYVASCRTRDIRACWPFPWELHSNRDEEVLARLPLSVPSFSCWDCTNVNVGGINESNERNASMQLDDNTERNAAQGSNGAISPVAQVKPSSIETMDGSESDTIMTSAEKEKHNATLCETPVASQCVVSHNKDVSKESSKVSTGKRSTKMCSKENGGTKGNNQMQLNERSMEVDEIEDNSSEDSENSGNHDSCPQDLPRQPDVSRAPHVKRPKKLRALADIFKSEVKVSENHTSENDSPPNIISGRTIRSEVGKSGAFVEIDLNVLPDSDESEEGNDEGVFEFRKREKTQMSPHVDNDIVVIGDASTGNATTSNFGSGPKSSSMGIKIDDKFTSEKKKCKRTRSGKEQPSWKSGQDIETESEHTKSGNVPSKSNQDAFGGRGLNLDLKRSREAKRDDKKIISDKNINRSKSADPKVSSMNLQDDMPRREQVIRNDVEKKDKAAGTIPLSYTEFSVADEHKSPDHTNRRKKRNITKKQNGISQAKAADSTPHFTGFGSSPNLQSKALCRTNNFENSDDIPKQPNKFATQTEERAKVTSKQRAWDDIPVEIVEPVPKNLQERRILNAERTTENSYSKKAEKTKEAGSHCGLQFGSMMKSIHHEHHAGLQTNHLSTDRNIDFVKGDSVGVNPPKNKQDSFLCPANRSKIDNFNISGPERSHRSMGVGESAKLYDNPSGAIQFPNRDSTLNSHENTTRIKEVEAHESPAATHSRSSEAHQRHQKAPGQVSSRGGGQLWLPNRDPFKVIGPEKFVADSNRKRMVSQSEEPSRREFFRRGYNIQLENTVRNSEYINVKRVNCAGPFVPRESREETRPMNMGGLNLFPEETMGAVALLKLGHEGQNFANPSPIPNDFQRNDVPSTNMNASTAKPSCDMFANNLSFDRDGSSSKKNENTVGGSASKLSDSFNPYSVKTQEKGNQKRKQTAAQLRGRKPKSSGPSRTTENPTARVELKARKKNAATLPVAPTGISEICSVNQNPADFTVPGPDNIYMIGSDDLKKKKKGKSKEKPGPSNEDSCKRKRQPPKKK